MENEMHSDIWFTSIPSFMYEIYANEIDRFFFFINN